MCLFGEFECEFECVTEWKHRIWFRPYEKKQPTNDWTNHWKLFRLACAVYANHVYILKHQLHSLSSSFSLRKLSVQTQIEVFWFGTNQANNPAKIAFWYWEKKNKVKWDREKKGQTTPRLRERERENIEHIKIISSDYLVSDSFICRLRWIFIMWFDSICIPTFGSITRAYTQTIRSFSGHFLFRLSKVKFWVWNIYQHKYLNITDINAYKMHHLDWY